MCGPDGKDAGDLQTDECKEKAITSEQVRNLELEGSIRGWPLKRVVTYEHEGEPPPPSDEGVFNF